MTVTDDVERWSEDARRNGVTTIVSRTTTSSPSGRFCADAVDDSARILADASRTDDFKRCIFPQPAEPEIRLFLAPQVEVIVAQNALLPDGNISTMSPPRTAAPGHTPYPCMGDRIRQVS